MKKILIPLLMLLPVTSQACPSLAGKWSSSLAQFQQFNQQWANIEEKAWSFMMQTQGREHITYSADNKMIIDSETTELVIGNKKMTRPAASEQLDFTILGCTNNSIVIQYDRYKQSQIAQLMFEDENNYWQYMGTADGGRNDHIREYYHRNNE